MEFIKRNQLKNKYIVLGKFYKLKYRDGDIKECRSILEIFLHSTYINLKRTNKIDAVFIMMNPGSGKPKESYNQTIIDIKKMKTNEIDKIKLVETDPDNTQYQVMRIMREKKWKYVRVINLSDYRNPSSEKFYNIIKEAIVYDKKFIHSIFSEDRIKELDNIFNSDKDFKVIVAWGVDTRLEKLIGLALGNKNLDKRVGNNKATYKKKKKFYYYHPLQRGKSKQIQWLESIINRI